jgi:hypothetical protein
MTLPTFLGIGVPRSGTTWLHTRLASHPDIYMPTRRKEVRFFDRGFDEGLAWYEAFFCPPEEAARYRAIGEISPQYLYCEECPARISETLPDVKLVLMLRHPIARAYSNYGFTVQRGNYRGTFEDFLASRPRSLEQGYYSRYLDGYSRLFDRTRFLILLFEETFAELDATEKRLADFLSVSADGFPPRAGGGKVNPSTVPSFGSFSRAAVRTGRRLRRFGLEPAVDLARRLGIQRAIAKGAPLPALDPGLKADLSGRYEDEFDVLEEQYGLDLSRWRT